MKQEPSAHSSSNVSARVTLGLAGAGLLLAAGIYLVALPPSSSETQHSPNSPARSIDDVYANLERLTQPQSASQHRSGAQVSVQLADVDTMIERLARRLETSPSDVSGWKMLGWSYFHVARYEEAAAAYDKALQLEPNSPEIKTHFEQAKAAAQKGSELISASGNGKEPPAAETQSGASLDRLHGTEGAIGSMVERLSERLRRFPNDVDGWTQLMRSRVVLGDRQAAMTAFRDATSALKADTAASAKIARVAADLGLIAQ